MLSGDLYVSVSNVHPIIRGLLNKHLIIQEGDSEVVQTFKEMVAEDLRARFCDELQLTNATMVASVLDPRFKHLKFIEADERAQVYDEVKRKVEALQVAEVEADDQEDKPAAPDPSKKAKQGLDFLLDSLDQSTDDEGGEDQFEEYRASKCKISNKTNPVKWWLGNGSNFPSVARLAGRYLCIPATSVPSERVFSSAGNIVNSKRSSLKPENVNMLVFLAKITKNV